MTERKNAREWLGAQAKASGRTPDGDVYDILVDLINSSATLSRRQTTMVARSIAQFLNKGGDSQNLLGLLTIATYINSCRE